MVTATYPLTRDEAVLLFGIGEKNLRLIEERMGVRAYTRGGELKITADTENEVKKIENLLQLMRKQILDGHIIPETKTLQHINTVNNGLSPIDNRGDFSGDIIINGRHSAIRPKTDSQQNFFEAIKEYDIVFAIGPAGTGKTFLAVAAALRALQSGEIDKVILARPAVEAGESLGFLPGDLKEKVDPYLRPLYDAIYEILPADKFHYYMKNSAIEIAPLAYMRGRTLNNAYAILDEAQNCTVGQMKMFLTRLGMNSKAIVTGDITQIDLREGLASGLVEIQKILQEVDGLKFCYFDRDDVIRHNLVKSIIDAYDVYEKRISKRK